MNNYDASQVGVPYVRAHKITIYYPDNGLLPWAEIEQSLAVKLADAKVRKLEELPPITAVFDLGDLGNAFVPLVSPDTGAPLDAGLIQQLAGLVASGHTSLNLVMLNLLAAVRQVQNSAQA